ncbi:hypothetical protein, partial [Pseudomonas viridiflava]|uniref:hypothetical protein n=1 Tax=Pseudomonas viridiflava TaxID=33069 RepID=UPI00197CD6B5
LIQRGCQHLVGDAETRDNVCRAFALATSRGCDAGETVRVIFLFSYPCLKNPYPHPEADILAKKPILG